MTDLDELTQQLRAHGALTDAQRAALTARAHVLRAEAMCDAWRGAASAIRRWIDAYRIWRRQRWTVIRLRALEDRLLADMGIHRTEIVSMVHGSGRGHGAMTGRLSRSNS